MVVLTAAVAVLALLLVYAGLVKLTRPDAVRATLRSAGIPDVRSAPFVIGAVELAVGSAALWSGHVLAPLALAATYAAFAAFSLRQRRRGAGCGCFGEPTAEVSRTHIGIDVLGALTGVAAAASAAPAAVRIADEGAVMTVLAVLLAVTAVAAVQLLMSVLPELAAQLAPEVDR